jgi:Tfp pilus assembly protein PilO
MRLLGWIVPILCMMISGAAIYRQHNRIQLGNTESAVLVTQIEAKQMELANLGLEPEPTVAIAEDQSDDEANQFVEVLKGLAGNSGIQLEKMMYVRSDLGQRANKKEQEYTPVSMQIVVTGDYLRVRDFVASLRTGPRLVVIGNSSWSKSGGITKLTLTVTRFVKGLGSSES